MAVSCKISLVMCICSYVENRCKMFEHLEIVVIYCLSMKIVKPGASRPSDGLLLGTEYKESVISI